MDNVTEMVPVDENDDDRSQFSELARYSRPMLTAAGVATIVIMVIGIIGNVLTIIALVRNSKIRTVAAAFIASLCISDLLFCLVVLPFSASQFFLGTWIHGNTLCYIIPMMRYGSVGVSLLSVATISVNRYILIAWPNQYSTIYTKTKVALYISLIWLFSYGTQIPTLLGKWGVFGFDEKLGTCSIKKDENGNSPKVALFVLAFIIPCIIIVVCYSKIYWVVHNSQKRLKQHGTAMVTKRSEMRVTRMVLVIFFCFVMCYLPLTLVKVFDGDVKYPVVHILGYLLLFAAACVNPVIYVTMNKQYRQAYFDTVKCKVGGTYDSSSPVQHHSKSIMSVMFARHYAVSPSPNPKV